MRILPISTAAFLLTASVFGFQEPPLPAWEPEEREGLEASGWIPGAILLTDDPIPDEPETPASEPLQVEQPKPEEVAEDLKPSPVIAEKFMLGQFFLDVIGIGEIMDIPDAVRDNHMLEAFVGFRILDDA